MNVTENTEFDLEAAKTIELLQRVFDSHMVCLEDHEDFEHIGEGKIKRHINQTLAERDCSS